MSEQLNNCSDTGLFKRMCQLLSARQPPACGPLQLLHQWDQLQQRRRRQQTCGCHTGRRRLISPILQDGKGATLSSFQNERSLTAVAASFEHPETLPSPRMEGMGDLSPSQRLTCTMCSSH